jgi:NAD(P)-dependent dehydrogenase (short-subunit alcohol dehydrogenase family)
VRHDHGARVQVTAGPFDLAGGTALVTGASSGFGRRFAQVLAQAGARVAVTARSTTRLEPIAREFAGPGGEPVLLAMDVRDRVSIRDAVQAAADALGHIDVLVNNAGVALTRDSLELTERDWDDVLDTNLHGAWFVAQAVARLMAARRRGSIINVASVLGMRGSGRVTPYVVSKHGLVGLTRALAVDMAKHGVRVNALAPGYFVTELTSDFLESRHGQSIQQRIPMRRFGELADLDGPLLLLASDAGRYLTGTVVPVDGGHAMSA